LVVLVLLVVLVVIGRDHGIARPMATDRGTMRSIGARSAQQYQHVAVIETSPPLFTPLAGPRLASMISVDRHALNGAASSVCASEDSGSPGAIAMVWLVLRTIGRRPHLRPRCRYHHVQLPRENGIPQCEQLKRV